MGLEVMHLAAGQAAPHFGEARPTPQQRENRLCASSRPGSTMSTPRRNMAAMASARPDARRG